MNKIKFILWVQCIPKGKRKVQNVKIGTQVFEKKYYDENKESIIKEQTHGSFIRIQKEQANKSIKDVTGARLVIREVEETEDAFGTMETYIPTNDVIITIL